MSVRETALQMEIIDRLARGMKRQAIADELGCNVKTVDRVKAEPTLKQAYYERCGALIEDLVPEAIKRLQSLIRDDGQQGSVHVAAVREVLDRSHLKELLDATEKKIEITVSYE